MILTKDTRLAVRPEAFEFSPNGKYVSLIVPWVYNTSLGAVQTSVSNVYINGTKITKSRNGIYNCENGATVWSSNSNVVTIIAVIGYK